MKIKESSMNYYTCENGYIGDYRGYEVHSIESKYFTKKDTLNNPEIIYAVKNNDFSFSLVRNGYLIGKMSVTGNINLYNRKAKWVFDTEGIETKKEEKKEVRVDKEVKNYSEYSKTVDNFFAGLDKWWKDLEKDA